MNGPAASALYYLFSAILGIVALLLLLRFVMQWVRADRYPPLESTIIRLSDPLTAPFRRVLPHLPRVDIASLLMAIVATLLKFGLARVLSFSAVYVGSYMLAPARMSIGALIFAAGVDVINTLFNIFIFALIIQAVLSWLPQMRGNPAESLLFRITEPVLAPIRGVIPPLGGLDLSVLVAIIGLGAAKIFVVGSLIGLIR